MVDRVGMRIVVDNVTTLGSVRFYISKRVGGTVLNNDAIKWLKTGVTMRGKVKTWHADRGFGFIKRDDGEEYFCHVRQLPFGMESLAVGNDVTFDLEPSRTKPGKQQACNVTVLE